VGDSVNIDFGAWDQHAHWWDGEAEQARQRSAVDDARTQARTAFGKIGSSTVGAALADTLQERHDAGQRQGDYAQGVARHIRANLDDYRGAEAVNEQRLAVGAVTDGPQPRQMSASSRATGGIQAHFKTGPAPQAPTPRPAPPPSPASGGDALTSLMLPPANPVPPAPLTPQQRWVDGMVAALAARPPDDPIAVQARRMAWEALHQQKQCDGWEWTTSAGGFAIALVGDAGLIAATPAGPADWAALGAALTGTVIAEGNLMKCWGEASEDPVGATYP
jgi:hypothetical protein